MVEVGDVNSLLFHGITLTQCYGVVFEGLVVDGDAEEGVPIASWRR